MAKKNSRVAKIIAAHGYLFSHVKESLLGDVMSCTVAICLAAVAIFVSRLAIRGDLF